MEVAKVKIPAWNSVPWSLRVLLAVLVLALSVALGMGAYDLAGQWAGGGRRQAEVEIETLRNRISDLEGQLALVRHGTPSDSELQIERKTMEELARQVKTLQAEKIQLQEDLALFEKFASTEGDAPGLTINGLRVERDSVPGQYRYRFLVAAQGGKKGQEFSAKLQVIVAMDQSGKRVMMVLPPRNDADDPHFSLTIRHFRRVDGTFLVPEGSQLVRVEVRLLRGGATSASQSINL